MVDHAKRRQVKREKESDAPKWLITQTGRDKMRQRESDEPKWSITEKGVK